MITRRFASTLAAVSTSFLFLFYLSRQWTPEVPQSGTLNFAPTTSKPKLAPESPASDRNYTRTLVIGRLSNEDVSWIDTELPGMKTAMYVVDDNSTEAALHIPRNKGHEAMVYLTYIIDHYDDLADTSIFFHPHLVTWHNNDLLDSNAATTIRHLSDAHVARVGYFNSRCHHEPGCPDWLHLDRPETEFDEYRKMEERFFTAKLWRELHPDAPLPPAISQPCCAQFAVSRDRIRSHPRAEYVRYRDWLLNADLGDEMSGRVMEYTWQYIFTGQAELCPAMNVCYCDGYGVCFGGAPEFQHWLDLRDQSRELEKKANRLSVEGKGDGQEAVIAREKVSALDTELQDLKRQAFERGKDPKNRAIECGRDWTDEDGV